MKDFFKKKKVSRLGKQLYIMYARTYAGARSLCLKNRKNKGERKEKRESFSLTLSIFLQQPLHVLQFPEHFFVGFPVAEYIVPV